MAEFWTDAEMAAIESGESNAGVRVMTAEERYADDKAENDFAADLPEREA
jgi:hypothetical protein